MCIHHHPYIKPREASWDALLDQLEVERGLPNVDITLGPTEVAAIGEKYLVEGATVYQLNDRGVNRLDAHVSGYRDGADATECERVARLFAAASDHALIARLLIHKLIRWEPFASNSGVGEICFKGLRYCTHLDEFGVPELHEHLRSVFAKAGMR